VVVENAIADQLVALLKEYAAEINLGAAYEMNTGMGPVMNKGHMDFVLKWIQTGVDEGAKLVVDGRNPEVPAGCEGGYFIGPTIFDHVTEDMSVGREEVFGPVLCVKRVDCFEEGLKS
jgi:malonate-semialdehyde dehydrogenase (acetylating)/methylmalonate-semialdehyde dehydrogenase